MLARRAKRTLAIKKKEADSGLDSELMKPVAAPEAAPRTPERRKPTSGFRQRSDTEEVVASSKTSQP